MEIKVLGTGCSSCRNLEKLVVDTLREMGVEADIEKVEDIDKIMSYGILRTPALVINGKVELYGRVPTDKEMKEIITNAIS